MKKWTIVGLLLVASVALAIGGTSREMGIDTIISTVTNGNITLTPNGSGIVATDNLGFDGNTISSTNTNGNLVLDANGAGSVQIQDRITYTPDLLDTGPLYLDSGIVMHEDQLAISRGGTGAGTASSGFDALSPLTTQGDVLYGGASGTGTRLGIGTAGQVLTVNSGATAPEWADASGGAGAGAFVNLAAEQDMNWNAETGDTTDFAETGGGTLAIETTTVFQGTNAISYDASADTDYVTFGPVDISSLDGNNCIASFWYNGFDANITAQVWDGTNVLNSKVLSAQTQWVRQEDGMSFICNDASTSNIYIRLLAGADAAIGYIDNVWVGENYTVGEMNLPNVYSAKIADDGTVSDESPVNWVEGNCTNADPRVCTFVTGFFSAAPNCTTDGTEEITATSSSSVSIDQDTAATTIACQKTGTDAVTIQSFDQTDRPWTAYTPTFTGFGTVSNVACYYARDSEDILIRCKFTAGSRTATEAQVTLPTGRTIASNVGSPEVCGLMAVTPVVASSYHTLCTAGDTFLNFGRQASAFGGLTPADGDEICSDSQACSFTARVPIEGWNATNGVGMVRHSATYGSEGVTKGCRFTITQDTSHTFTDYDGCVASVDDDGAGATGVNFNAGYWSGNLTCQVTPSGTAGTRICQHENKSTAGVDVTCRNSSATESDTIFDMECKGAP